MMYRVGTSVEHHTLYQYQLANTKDVYMGFIQTETPYVFFRSFQSQYNSAEATNTSDAAIINPTLQRPHRLLWYPH